MISATFLLMVPVPATSSRQHAPRRGIGLVSECWRLDPTAQTAAAVEGPHLAHGLRAGLELVKDLQSARVIGKFPSGGHPIKSPAEMRVGVRHTPLFQQ